MAQPPSEEPETYFRPIVRNTFIDLEQVNVHLPRCVSEPTWYSTCIESGSEETETDQMAWTEGANSPIQAVAAMAESFGQEEPCTTIAVRQDACGSDDPALVEVNQMDPEPFADLPDQEDVMEPAPRIPMAQLHAQGRCTPCLYLTRKNDGCWKGDACLHCHLCSRQEAKRRRNRMHLEARKAAKARARLQEENKDEEGDQ